MFKEYGPTRHDIVGSSIVTVSGPNLIMLVLVKFFNSHIPLLMENSLHSQRIHVDVLNNKEVLLLFKKSYVMVSVQDYFCTIH